MDRKYLSAIGALALVAPACDRATTSSSEPGLIIPNGEEPPPSTGADLPAEPSPAPPNPAAATGDGIGVNDGYPNLTPATLTPEAEKGIKGATNIMLSFARAIELEEYDQAWTMLGEVGRAKWSQAKFAGLFSDLDKKTVAFTPGTVEGGAGSLYYESQLTITADDEDGRPVRIEGPVVLRRVNDVDGATPAQLRWHFSQITLNHTH